MLILGIAMLFAGMFMLVYPFMASVAVTLVTGWVLIGASVVQLVTGIIGKSEGGKLLWPLVLTFAYAVAGIMLVANPLAGTVTLTMIFTIWLFADGFVNVLYAVVQREPGWGWQLTSGIISIVLGVMLLNAWPTSALWVVGLFAGITLMIRGMTAIVMSSEIRRLSK
jgi:uncharacterized membrane protein HdeD (DUF308 family)